MRLEQLLVSAVCSSVALSRASLTGAPAIWDGQRWKTKSFEDPRGQSPQPPSGDAHLRNDTIIFVSIASYRDGARCGRSIFSLFSTAAFPSRIRFGVVEQNAVGDTNCQDEFCRLIGKNNPALCRQLTSQITVQRQDASEARGPVRARALGNLLRGSEADQDFCMQVDSHVLASQNWDTTLIRQWSETRNEWGILTTVPPPLDELDVNVNGRQEVPMMCRLGFSDEGMPRNELGARAINLGEQPLLTPLWSAGFSFSKCLADAVAPYDPHLSEVFDGEDFSRGARLWTHGFDFYTPPHSVIFHNYTWDGAAKRQLGWPRDQVELARSRRRLFSLLGMPGGSQAEAEALGIFGLGTARSLAQYEEVAGVRLSEHVNVDPERRACGFALPWVPPSRQQQQQQRDTALAASAAASSTSSSFAGRWEQRERRRVMTKGGSLDVFGVECGRRPLLPDVAGVGGFTASCHLLLAASSKMTLPACEAERDRRGCGALTYRAGGLCTLHDTHARGFGTEQVVGSVFGQAARPCLLSDGGGGGAGSSGQDGSPMAHLEQVAIWRLGNLRSIPLIHLVALVIFWVVVFALRDASSPSDGDRDDEDSRTGRHARHPDAWAEFTKTHVV